MPRRISSRRQRNIDRRAAAGLAILAKRMSEGLMMESSYAGLTRVSINSQKTSLGDGLPGHRRAEATPFFERLSPAMTTYVPLGLTRRVGRALAGSSGQGWRG